MKRTETIPYPQLEAQFTAYNRHVLAEYGKYTRGASVAVLPFRVSPSSTPSAVKPAAFPAFRGSDVSPLNAEGSIGSSSTEVDGAVAVDENEEALAMMYDQLVAIAGTSPEDLDVDPAFKENYLAWLDIEVPLPGGRKWCT